MQVGTQQGCPHVAGMRLGTCAGLQGRLGGERRLSCPTEVIIRGWGEAMEVIQSELLNRKMISQLLEEVLEGGEAGVREEPFKSK